MSHSTEENFGRDDLIARSRKSSSESLSSSQSEKIQDEAELKRSRKSSSASSSSSLSSMSESENDAELSRDVEGGLDLSGDVDMQSDVDEANHLPINLNLNNSSDSSEDLTPAGPINMESNCLAAAFELRRSTRNRNPNPTNQPDDQAIPLKLSSIKRKPVQKKDEILLWVSVPE